MNFATSRLMNLECIKLVLPRGSAPESGPRWGSSRHSPDLLVGWGGDTPPHTPPLDAFGAAVSALVWFVPQLNFSFPRSC